MIHIYTSHIYYYWSSCHRRIAGGALGCGSTPKLLEKLEIFWLSEILRRRSEIFITYLYRNALSFCKNLYFTNYEVLSFK